MNVLQKCLVGLVLVSWLGGCVAAECRAGSHEEGGKCVADDAGEGGSAGEGGASGTGGAAAGQGGNAGNAGSGGTGAVAVEEDAGADMDADVASDTGMEPVMCGAGYEPDGFGGCRDIDECVNDNGGCDVLTTCVNGSGSRDCTACPVGYSGTGATGCVEIDECASGVDDCDEMPSATCANSTGAYSCACPTGFEGDGHGAEGCGDIDECAVANGGCDTEPMVTCTNTEGGRSCGACPSGYVGNGIGNNGCREINECLDNNGGCDAAAQCTNILGGRTCGACPAGYVGDGAQVDGCVPQLASLTFMPGLSETFDPATTAYTLTVSQVLGYAEVRATSLVPGATITAGSVVLGEESTFVSLGSGANVLNVTVRDSYGRSRVYAVTVTRQSAIAQTAYLKPAAPLNNEYVSFGLHVAVSGDTLAISRLSPGNYGGAVEIYVRNGGSWSHQATLDPHVESGAPSRLSNGFGRSGLALDGDTLAVGESALAGISGRTAGAVQVYTRTGSTWTQQTTLYPMNADNGDDFGRSVAVSGDRIVVGAPQEDSASTTSTSNDSAAGAGAAYVFARSGGAWTFEKYLKAGSPGAGDNFGNSVDIYRSTIVIGAPNEDGSGFDRAPPVDEGRSNSGAVYIFERDTNGAWAAPVYMKPSQPRAAVDGLLGFAVAIGSENLFAAGAPGAGASGLATVFHNDGTAGWNEVRSLTSVSSAQDNFGRAIDMWGPGTLVVAASGDDSSNTIVNGAPNDNAQDSGAAYLFVSSNNFSSATTSHLKTRNAEAGDAVLGSYGTSVAVGPGVVLMGAIGEDSSANGVQTPGPTPFDDIDVNGAYSGGAAYTFR